MRNQWQLSSPTNVRLPNNVRRLCHNERGEWSNSMSSFYRVFSLTTRPPLWMTKQQKRNNSSKRISSNAHRFKK